MKSSDFETIKHTWLLYLDGRISDFSFLLLLFCFKQLYFVDERRLFGFSVSPLQGMFMLCGCHGKGGTIITIKSFIDILYCHSLLAHDLAMNCEVFSIRKPVILLLICVSSVRYIKRTVLASNAYVW